MCKAGFEGTKGSNRERGRQLQKSEGFPYPTIQTPICCVQRDSGADRQQIERSPPPELTSAANAVDGRSGPKGVSRILDFALPRNSIGGIRTAWRNRLLAEELKVLENNSGG